MVSTQIERAEKIEESKEIIAEVEELVNVPLNDARWALGTAGKYTHRDSVYVEQMVAAMAETAGYAIEDGHDDLASKAIQKVIDLRDILSDDE